MPITTYQANAFLDSMTSIFIQLHSGDPGADGTSNVITLDRQEATYNAASGKSRTLSSTVVFPDCPATVIRAISLWDALTSGNCLNTAWLQGAPKAFTGEISAELITCPAHGLVADDQVVFYDDGVGTLPTGISEATLYYVISTGLTTDAFKVSTTQGGSAVDITATGQGLVSKVSPKTIIEAGATFNLTAAPISLA